MAKKINGRVQAKKLHGKSVAARRRAAKKFTGVSDSHVALLKEWARR